MRTNISYILLIFCFTFNAIFGREVISEPGGYLDKVKKFKKAIQIQDYSSALKTLESIQNTGELDIVNPSVRDYLAFVGLYPANQVDESGAAALLALRGALKKKREEIEAKMAQPGAQQTPPIPPTGTIGESFIAGPGGLLNLVKAYNKALSTKDSAGAISALNDLLDKAEKMLDSVVVRDYLADRGLYPANKVDLTEDEIKSGAANGFLRDRIGKRIADLGGQVPPPPPPGGFPPPPSPSSSGNVSPGGPKIPVTPTANPGLKPLLLDLDKNLLISATQTGLDARLKYYGDDMQKTRKLIAQLLAGPAIAPNVLNNLTEVIQFFKDVSPVTGIPKGNAKIRNLRYNELLVLLGIKPGQEEKPEEKNENKENKEEEAKKPKKRLEVLREKANLILKNSPSNETAKKLLEAIGIVEDNVELEDQKEIEDQLGYLEAAIKEVNDQGVITGPYNYNFNFVRFNNLQKSKTTVREILKAINNIRTRGKPAIVKNYSSLLEQLEAMAKPELKKKINEVDKEKIKKMNDVIDLVNTAVFNQAGLLFDGAKVRFIGLKKELGIKD